MARFSLPLNTKLPEDFVLNTFIPFLKEHKDYIYDIYFTCRMPPFVQDAMGDVIDGDMRDTTLNALYVSQEQVFLYQQHLIISKFHLHKRT